MQAFIWYLLKVGICIAAFWLLYRLLLSRDTFHGLNRAVLLASAVLAFLIPAGFITLPAEASGPEPYTAITPIGDEFRTDRIRTAPTPEPLAEPQAAEPDRPVSAEHRPLLPTLIAYLFWSGAAVSLLRMLASVTEILRTVRAGERTRLDRHTVLVHTADHTVPFSWMRYIVLPHSDCNEHEIIAHEQAHLRLGHSWDLLLLDAAGCLQWFNPFMRLLRRELQDIHEYEADRAVLRAGFNPKEYQMLLIKKAAGAGRYSVADGLGHSNLKKRITMMLKKDSGSRARWKVLAMLPLACIALTAFAQREYDGRQGKDNIIYSSQEDIYLHYKLPDDTQITKGIEFFVQDGSTPARYLCADLSIVRFPRRNGDHFTATLYLKPTNRIDRTYNPNRFYIDLYHTETETYNDIFDLVAQYAPELHASIPEEFLRYPITTELTTGAGRYDLGCSRTGDSPQSTTASIDVSCGEDDDTTITHSYLTFPIRYVRLDAEGNAYVGDEQVRPARLPRVLLRQMQAEGIDVPGKEIPCTLVYVTADQQTPWAAFQQVKTTLEKENDYEYFVRLAGDTSFPGGINQHIESSPYQLSRHDLKTRVPYYAGFDRVWTTEQAATHLAEVTITDRKVAVNGRESSIENLAGDIMREAERNGFPMSEMMIGIWPADNAEVGTVQAVKYEASRLVPKYLVLVVEDYGKGGEIVRVNGQS